MKEKRFVIIDGNALIHRSFHALPSTIATKNGQIVNAVYGFTSFLFKSLKELKPDYLILSLDERGETFRHKEYKDYKATRVKAPQELYDQIPLVIDIAKAFNIPVFSQQGYEADDIIGSLIKQLEEDPESKNWEKIIITGDLDTLQLINPHTKIYTMSRGLTDAIFYDEQKVKEKYNLRPDQIVDFKALRGDPSDNIPGVKGIGEKTAIELLNLFDNLEKVYEYVEKKEDSQEKIKPTIINKLKEHKEEAFLSKKLATIEKDMELDLNLQEAELKRFNKTKIRNIFSELEFKSLLSKLPELEKTLFKSEDYEKADKFKRNKQEFDYILVDTDKKFKNFLKQLKKQESFTLDLETSSLDIFSAEVLGISFSWEEGKAFYLQIADKKNQYSQDENLFNYNQEKKEKLHPWLKELTPILENSDIKKYGHNIKFDLRILQNQGIKVKGIDFDTKIAAYLINPSNRQHNLDSLTFNEFGFEKINHNDLVGKGKNKISYGQVTPENMSLYSCEDADFTHRLVRKLEKELQEANLLKLFKEIEVPLIEVLADMENNGINLDTEFLKKMEKEVSKNLEDLTKKIYELAGKEFNINSTQQLQKIIYEDLNITSKNVKKTKKGFSTAFDELEKIKDLHPIIALIQDYRELYKLKTTYISSLPKLVNKKTKKLHTNFNQTITATGRLSSTDPNLQNIPIRTELGQKIRKAFTASPGKKIVSLDYSQIELRLAAHLSKDKKMIQAFKANEDIHLATASEINQVKPEEVTKDMRREAKAVNFGIIYGQGPHGLSQSAGIDYKTAKDFIAKYFEIYSGVKTFIDKTIEEAKEKNYVKTIFDRTRYVSEINSEISFVKKAAERVAINTPLQGSAADIIKVAMNKVFKELDLENKKDIKTLLQVHDELIFEIEEDKVKKYAKEIKKIMENIIKLKVPLIVDTDQGDNWGDLKPLHV